MRDRCTFLPHNSNLCTVLANTECTGTKSKKVCSFRKTEKEFRQEQNRAIIPNRKKGNCAKCKYKKFSCEPMQLGDDDNDY